MNVKSYALTVFAVIILSTIAQFVLPSGRTKKITKTVLSLAIATVVLSPVINMIGGGNGIELSYQEQTFVIDDDFVDYVDYLATASACKEIEEKLLSSGFGKKLVSVDCAIDNSTKQLKSVWIKLDMTGINEKDEHTYISEITDFILTEFDLEKGDVIVSG